MAKDSETAALEAATKLLEPEAEETTETEAGQETPEGEAPQETEKEEPPLFPEFEIDLPEELEAELSAPTPEEIQRELEQDDQYQELDEESRKLLARAKAAEKEAEFYRSQRIKSERKNWTEEAKKFFPLSAHALEGIQADSRRGFLRQAKAAHEAVLPHVKEIQEQYKAVQEKAIEEATAQARADAEKAWGKPAVDKREPAEATIAQDQLARNRARGDFSATVKAMLFSKKED